MGCSASVPDVVVVQGRTLANIQYRNDDHGENFDDHNSSEKDTLL